MLIVSWLMLGLSLLMFEAGSLSLGAPSGNFVSPVGALKFNLSENAPIPFSEWPWGDVALGSVLSKSIKGLF